MTKAHRKPNNKQAKGGIDGPACSDVSVNTNNEKDQCVKLPPPLSVIEPGAGRLKRLRELASQSPPPQEWYDEDFSGLVQTPSKKA